MSQPTYGARAIVLRKTKLGESDLIVTMLAEDGSQMRAVAKGARKPASSFAARLELYSVADALLARGRSLDIVKEVRLVEATSACAATIGTPPGARSRGRDNSTASQMGLENPACSRSARSVASLGVEAAQVPAVCAAHLLKTLVRGAAPRHLDVRGLRAV